VHGPIGTGRLRACRRFGYWREQIGHLSDQSGHHLGDAPAELEPATAGWFRNGYGNVESTGRPATDR